jgi:large subunit ribosomal protein L35
MHAPRISVQKFDPHDESLFTFVLVDPDVPIPEKQTYTTRLHWILTNAQTAVGAPLVDEAKCSTVVPYLPPYPQEGEPKHRLVLLAFARSARLEVSAPERENFRVRDFVSEHGLQPVGVTFWRAVWDENVHEVMKKYGLGEPVKYRRIQ